MIQYKTKPMSTDHKHEQVYPGLSARNFRKIAPNGFGDPYNSYPHSMGWFHDHLYVGTTRANLANRAIQIASSTPDRLGEIWPVKVPDSYFDNDLRAEIWRYYPRKNEWNRVFVSPVVRGIDGFDVPLSVGFRCMASFQGLSDSAPALYVPTWGSHQTPTTLMLRSGDGINFEVVSEPGQCIPDHKPRSLRGLVPFKRCLFTSPVVGQQRLEPNIAKFMVILVSSDPARGNWRLACEPHFGDSNNQSVFHMATFNGYLYAGTLNINEGFQIWKTDAEGEPPYKWEKVLAKGAYRGKLNQIAMTLIPFGNHLYVGSAIQNCSFDYDNNIGPAAPELIRINPDDSWDIVVGEPRFTPEGLKVPLSGLGPGFGSPFAGYIWSMCVHEGWLYVATAVWAVFLRYAGREDRWPELLRSKFSSNNVEKMLPKFGGCDLWRTRDGIHWIPVTLNGFDNYFNIGFRNMVSTPYGLFVGAANPFAPEVAVKRIAGWNYEHNSKGGLEIWLGSHNSETNNWLACSAATEPYISEKRVGTGFNGENKTDTLENLISRFYGYSDFRTTGFWREDIHDAKTASENLMDEILAFIPDRKSTILEVGCNRGATTGYLLKYFNPDCVVGVTSDKNTIKACRRNAPGARFVCMKLPKLEFQRNSFENIISIDGVRSFGRENMLREIFRVLRPGGQMICLDLLCENVKRNNGRKYNHKLKNWAEKPDSYKKFLFKLGFHKIKVFDVTNECLRGLKRHMRKYFEPLVLSGEVDTDIIHKIQVSLLTTELPISYCLLISARKPPQNADTKIKQ